MAENKKSITALEQVALDALEEILRSATDQDVRLRAVLETLNRAGAARRLPMPASGSQFTG